MGGGKGDEVGRLGRAGAWVSEGIGWEVLKAENSQKFSVKKINQEKILKSSLHSDFFL